MKQIKELFKLNDTLEEIVRLAEEDEIDNPPTELQKKYWQHRIDGNPFEITENDILENIENIERK